MEHKDPTDVPDTPHSKGLGETGMSPRPHQTPRGIHTPRASQYRQMGSSEWTCTEGQANSLLAIQLCKEEGFSLRTASCPSFWESLGTIGFSG